MNNIKVEKAKLLEILKKNRDEHKQIFEEALAGYRRTVIAEFERRLDDARNGRKINIHFSLVQPVDQTKDYDRAIAMLEMDLNETIELEEHDFQCYVLDEWAWQNNFLTSNSFYSASASTKMRGN